ncbi:MAG TPA: hypothetical protein VHM64_06730 [Candidatus Binatia bacterium]|nr:hypothetical protein [Candidatus Binatia bacterium]
MKSTEIDRAGCPEPASLAIDDIIGDLFHDAQNGVHLVGMELELVSMGLGTSSDAVKTARTVKQLENNLRDLRGYVSACQHPSSTCDIAAVLETVIASFQMRHRNDQDQIVASRSESLPQVLGHPKLLTRILERAFEFCEEILSRGGQLNLRAARCQAGSQTYAELELTMLASVDIPMIAEEELCANRSLKTGPYLGVQRALEILRRRGGQTIFRRRSDRECQLILRIPASSQ